MGKDDPPYWLLNSLSHTLGDTHQGHRGPKLDMHKFDSTYMAGWVSQMEHFFFLHNIHTNVDKYQMVLFDLDAQCLKWRQWHKQCMVGPLNWSTFSKALCFHFDQLSHFLGRLTKLYQI